MRMRILASASRDLEMGYRFYERQAQGLGGYFLDSLYADIDSLLISAGIHTRCFGSYYRLLSRRFPFAVYYRMKGVQVTVYAVLDTRRDPARIRRRFG